jgi:hypothetical protein
VSDQENKPKENEDDVEGHGVLADQPTVEKPDVEGHSLLAEEVDDPDVEGHMYEPSPVIDTTNVD